MLLEILISIILVFGQATWINHDTLQIQFSRSTPNVYMICIEKQSAAFSEPVHIDPCTNTPTDNIYTHTLTTGNDHAYNPDKDDRYRIIEYQREDGKVELLYGEWFTISNKRPNKYQQILPIIVK